MGAIRRYRADTRVEKRQTTALQRGDSDPAHTRPAGNPARRPCEGEAHKVADNQHHATQTTSRKDRVAGPRLSSPGPTAEQQGHVRSHKRFSLPTALKRQPPTQGPIEENRTPSTRLTLPDTISRTGDLHKCPGLARGAQPEEPDRHPGFAIKRADINHMMLYITGEGQPRDLQGTQPPGDLGARSHSALLPERPDYHRAARPISLKYQNGQEGMQNG